jgi:GT2 family glycosyltransferase
MDRPTAVDQPMASAFLIRRAALEEVGTFDERFPLFFNDVDLCYRLKAAGWEIQYDPRVQVVHVGGASTRQVRPQAILASHAGLALFYALHYRDRLAWPTYAAIVIIIHGTGWLRTGRLSANGGGRTAWRTGYRSGMRPSRLVRKGWTPW